MLAQLRGAAWALRQVASNEDIRRAQAAWLLGWASELAWLVALLVYAFAIGGVAAVGLIGVVRTLPAAILAPALSGATDRLPRHRVLLAVHGGRAMLVALAATSVVAGWPPVVVFMLAPLDGLLGVLHRPTHMSMAPALARAPEQLVAANVASSTLEGVGVLLGPLAGGLLIATGMTGLTFAVPAAGFAAAALTVIGIQPAQRLRREQPRQGGLALLLGGARLLREHPHAALLLGLFGAQVLVRGLLNVLLVVVAVDLLAIGEQGVGYLNGAIGAGGFLGALAAMTLVGHARLAPPVFAGLVLWGTPILFIGLLPSTPVAVLSLVVLGGGNALLDVAGFTLLQRTVPNAGRGRVFGLLEAIVMLMLAVGSALAPVLVATLGIRGALLATGLILPILATVGWAWLRRADEHSVVPARELALLRGVPMLGLLPLTVLEEVAGELERQRHPARSRIISRGEAGDRFFIVAAGHVQVSVNERVVRVLGGGESFGEIALLRDVRRTADVTALDDVELVALDRHAFVAAVTGDRHAVRAADDVVERRLAAMGG